MEKMNLTHASNSYITHRGITRILKFLEADPKQIWEVKSISETCKIKKSCCYAYLARLKNQGLIERVSAGFYRYQPGAQSNLAAQVAQKTPMFHNLHLSKLLEKGDSPPLPPNNKNQESNRILLDLEKRKIEIRWNKNNVEIIISATDKPLTFQELDSMLELLGKIYNLGDKNNFYILNYDMNIDIENMRLDGLSAFTYQNLKGLLWKAYNKGDGLRMEVCANKSIPFSELVDFFRGKGIAGAYELTQAVKELKNGIRSLSYQYKKREKFLDYQGVV